MWCVFLSFSSPYSTHHSIIQISGTIDSGESDYDENYTVDRIITISGKKSDMSFIAQLNNGEYGLIAGNVAKKEFPQKVIEFYESKIKFFDRLFK